jgi:transcriptional regulator with XRE-family HTH domain
VSTDRTPPREPTGLAKAGTFGDLLRGAREARGLALEAVADATRIARHHLDALERSDLDALPAGPFGKGYVRAYAKVVGIDPEPILEAYRVRERQRGLGTAEDERRMLEELSHLVQRPEGKERPALLSAQGGGLTLAVVLGILGALGWFLTRARAPESSVATLPLLQPRASPEVGALREREPAESRTHPKAVEAFAAPTDALEVSDHGVGTDLEGRRLVGRADRFPVGTRVSFLTLVLGGQPGHVIRHVWFQEGRAVMRADLPIGGPHWRTYSRLLLPEGSAGRWAVEARTSDGRLLARDEFLCESDGR